MTDLESLHTAYTSYLAKQLAWNETIAAHGEYRYKSLIAETEMLVAWRKLTQARERAAA